jgi:predicted PurR-regulated permease PerM
MDKQKLQSYFLLAILLITVVLSFFIFRPFLLTIILAIIFAVVFEPIHKKIVNFTHGRNNLSALLTVFIILLFIFTPLFFLGMQIFHEASHLYTYFSNNGGSDGIFHIGSNFVNKFQDFLPESQKVLINFDQYLKQGLQWLLSNVGFIFSNIAKIFLSSFIFVIALFYFLKDGTKIKNLIMKFSPLMDVDNKTILEKLKLAINSVVRGTLLVALIQGILTAVGFTIFGVPNAVLWGTIAVIAALVPTIGTALVSIPAILFLFLSGNVYASLGLLIWATVAVGLVDNFLGPKFIERGMKLNPLIILLAVLGGIILFGPVGFLLGPLIIGLLFTLIGIYFLRKED